ncbi:MULTISPECIES: ATP-binding protein [Actinomadura]|uniref:ATP-binding protein n=1 Tax=Actinomadura yumaensis TaxID=111807 RepID=A0ABW2CUD2_9ACTN|nr:LuxR C-terminal-related transcriptional regulator [Actinomadura sp. J1-007]MWK38634.1 AAA family ATPase [Actinomadura sp. J1-007]
MNHGAGNLPAEVTRFIGRSGELAEGARILERARLLTLCGASGVGKTRLALRLAADARKRHPHGAWLVELSGLREPHLVPRAVAEALHLHDRPDADTVEALEEFLADRRLLLVLDTCEHLVDACAMLAELLLRAAPGLRILATSQQPLNVMGEHTYLVPPLDSGVGADGAADCTEPSEPSEPSESVELFGDRAAGIVPGFALTDANRPAVARLCRRLDGLPLAIELAAVRLRSMTLEQIAARLDDRFRLLGTARSRHARHQTLRAAVSWTHDLCDPSERLLWARASVFPGGFDVEAAEAVCAGGEEVPAGDVLDLLGRLVDKSVMTCDRGTGRYRMLDTLREFGAERLSPADLRELRRRHRDHYLALVRRAADGEMGPRQLALAGGLRDEHHNLRAALDHCLRTPGEAPAALRMLVALHFYWVLTGRFGEARSWLARALARTPPGGADRGWALYSAAAFAAAQGDLASAGSLVDELRDAHGDDAALRACTEQIHAIATFVAGDPEAARASLERALAAQAAVGFDRPHALVTFPVLAAALGVLGEAGRALEVAEEGLRVCAATGEQWCRSYLLWARALVRWLEGDPDAALADVLACLRIKEASADGVGAALALDLTAYCLAARGEGDRAAILLGASGALWERLRVSMPGPVYTGVRDAELSRLGVRLGPERLALARGHGAALPLGEATALARGERDPALPRAAPPAGSADDPLTRREREIAALVAEGLANREIAERLVISKRTVDSHVEHILAKLGFGSRTQIAAWTQRRP